MSTLRFALVLTVPLGLWVGCAGTSLDVPAKSAANPSAHTMPVSATSAPLSDDFDPWKGIEDDSSPSHDTHGGHHHE